MSTRLGPCPAGSLFTRKLFHTLTIEKQLNWSICPLGPASIMHILTPWRPPATGISSSDHLSGCACAVFQWVNTRLACGVHKSMNKSWLIQQIRPSFRLKTAGVVFCFHPKIHPQHLSGSFGFAGLFGADVKMISSVTWDQIALPYEICVL